MRLSHRRDSRDAHRSLPPSPSEASVSLPTPCRPSNSTSAQPDMVEHTYTLEHSSFPYVSLSLNSAAASPDHTPVIRQTPPVTGSVVLELSSLRSIKDVLLTVHGRLHTPGSSPSSFLSHTLSLFAPATPQPPPETSTIDGTHTIPFEFYLPTLGSNGAPLPPSWASALSPSCKIEYTLSLRVRPKSKAHHFVSGDDVLNVPIIFVPKSALREKAGSGLAWSAVPGAALGDWPMERDAWHLSSATLRGSQIAQRDVPLRATLGLAAPLTYPVHSSIPFTLTLSDDKHDAPDVLAAPIAITVDLRRAVRYVPTSSPTPCPRCSSYNCSCDRHHHHNPLHHHHHHHHHPSPTSTLAQEWTWEPVTTARCWQVPHTSPYIRIVHGSLDLSSLEPSFAFGGLSVGYAVHVSFSAPVAGGAMEEERFTFVEPVTLVGEAWPHPLSQQHQHPLALVPSSSSSASSTASSPRQPPATMYTDEPPSYEQTQACYGYTQYASHTPAHSYSHSPSSSASTSRPVTPTHAHRTHVSRSSSLAPPPERIRRSKSGERPKAHTLLAYGGGGMGAEWMRSEEALLA